MYKNGCCKYVYVCIRMGAVSMCMYKNGYKDALLCSKILKKNTSWGRTSAFILLE